MTRDPLDRYYTPDEVAAAVVRWLRIPPHYAICEPSVGSGSWVRALRAAGHTGRIIGCDIDPDAAGLQLVDEAHVGDWVEVAPRVRADLHLGNPPFRPLVAHVEASLAVCTRVVTLARPSILEGTQKRAPWLGRRRPVREWTFLERIGFGGPAGVEGGEDSVCHTMLFWSPGKTSGGWHRDLVSVARDEGPARPIRWAS